MAGRPLGHPQRRELLAPVDLKRGIVIIPLAARCAQLLGGLTRHNLFGNSLVAVD